MRRTLPLAAALALTARSQGLVRSLVGNAGEGLGQSFLQVGDQNGDGVPDLLVGAPMNDGTILTPDIGAVLVWSGATHELMSVHTGSTGQFIGSRLAAIGDHDANPGGEYAVGMPHLNNYTGELQVWSLYPTKPAVYCTAKTNSLGCTPPVGWSGSPSATSAAPFTITASNVLNNAPAILFYGSDAKAVPFEGGVLCVGAPVTRTAGQLSGGTPPPAKDCSGTYALQFNAHIQTGNPLLVLGAQVFCQWWSRAPRP